MVMVAFLNCANFALEPQNGGAILTQDTSRGWNCTKSRMASVFGANVMVLATFKSEHLTAVTADATVRGWRVAHLFHDPFGKSFQNLGVIAQITSFDELDVFVFCRHLIGETIDPVDQDAGKQEVREHNDALVRQACYVLQARLNQREGHAGIANFAPAKAHPLLKHPCNFRDVAVRVRVRGPAPDHDKACLG